jgi:tripartite-type tricarboxylate transporter receptor subunit TctC
MMFKTFGRSARAFHLAIFAVIVGLAGLVPAGKAQAQAKYPERPIKVIVPFGAGGLADVSIRFVAERLSKNLGQQLVIENIPGSGGIAAANELAKTPADGHTLIVISNGTAISEALFAKLPYSTAKDMAPVSTVAWFDMMAVTGSKKPYKTMKDFIAAAHAKPGALNIGTINPGSTQNLSAELLKSLAKVDAQIVPFKATPDIVVSLIRNDIDLAIDSYTAIKGQVDSGELRPLAVTGVTRNPSLPNVPTFAEAGVTGYDVTGWNALFVKAGTPKPIVDRLAKEIAAVTAMDEVKKKYLELGIVAGSTTPDVIGKRLKDDIAKWSDVIAKAGIKKL